MKSTNEFRNLNDNELLQKQAELHLLLINNKDFVHPKISIMKSKNIRKDIARIKTILKERLLHAR